MCVGEFCFEEICFGMDEEKGWCINAILSDILRDLEEEERREAYLNS